MSVLNYLFPDSPGIKAYVLKSWRSWEFWRISSLITILVRISTHIKLLLSLFFNAQVSDKEISSFKYMQISLQILRGWLLTCKNIHLTFKTPTSISRNAGKNSLCVGSSVSSVWSRLLSVIYSVRPSSGFACYQPTYRPPDVSSVCSPPAWPPCRRGLPQNPHYRGWYSSFNARLISFLQLGDMSCILKPPQPLRWKRESPKVQRLSLK